MARPSNLTNRSRKKPKKTTAAERAAMDPAYAAELKKVQAEARVRNKAAPKPKPATKPVGRVAPKTTREESVQQAAPDPVKQADAVRRENDAVAMAHMMASQQGGDPEDYIAEARANLAAHAKPAKESQAAYGARLRKSLNPKGQTQEEKLKAAAPHMTATQRKEWLARPVAGSGPTRETVQRDAGRFNLRGKGTGGSIETQIMATHAAGGRGPELGRQFDEASRKKGGRLSKKEALGVAEAFFKSAPTPSKASSHKPTQAKSVTTSPGPTKAQIQAGAAQGLPFGALGSRAPSKPKQRSGPKRDLVMTPKQIARRAARARKAGRG